MASEETTRREHQNEPADDNQDQNADVHQNKHIDSHQEEQKDTWENTEEIIIESETNHEGSIAHTTTSVDIQEGDSIETTQAGFCGSSLDLLPVEIVETVENDSQQPKNVTNASSSQPVRTCEPCLYQNFEVEATKYCKECDELYCNPCTLSHTSQHQTKNHTIIEIDELKPDLPITQMFDSPICEPCNFKEKAVEALFLCENCNEKLCDECRLFHIAQKRNRDHRIRSLANPIYCEACNTQGKVGIIATKYCIDCKYPEAFCESCAKQHTAMKISRNHQFSPDLSKIITRSCEQPVDNQDFTGDIQEKSTSQGDMTASDTTDAESPNQVRVVLLCEPCSNQELHETATHYCLICDERYCDKCTKRHRAHKRTEGHGIIDLSQVQGLHSNCDFCQYNGEEKMPHTSAVL